MDALGRGSMTQRALDLNAALSRIHPLPADRLFRTSCRRIRMVRPVEVERYQRPNVVGAPAQVPQCSPLSDGPKSENPDRWSPIRHGTKRWITCWRTPESTHRATAHRPPRRLSAGTKPCPPGNRQRTPNQRSPGRRRVFSDGTLEILDLQTTIEQTAQDNEVLQSLSAEIRAEASVRPVGKLSSGLVSQLKRTMKTSFSESFQVSSSTKSGHELTTEVSYDRSGAAQPLAHVRKFQRNRAVLYLAYIDYLVVDYRRQFGIRKRRQKSPSPHQNVLKINVPVVAIEYWKEYDGISWVNEATHNNEVPEPYELEIVDAMHEKSGFVSFPRVHSLYRISNAAFPLQWIKRKGVWTEEELIALEEKEYVEGVEDSWIWQRRK